jgi:AcrR family transcriptional regulator
MARSATGARTRNPRGEGARLRDEIVDAAGELLERRGGEAAITLRAVARGVGISAPSIYPHFANREEILGAVLTRAADALLARLRAAARGAEDPVDRLRALARAYVAFAAEQPHRYRLLFERASPPAAAAAFAILLDAVRASVAAGASAAPSPPAAAIELWVALHGYVTLRPAASGVPWPETEDVLESLVIRLAWIPASPPGA